MTDQGAGDSNGPANKGVWCLVANVRESLPNGPGGRDTQRGTRLLAPGARVYCFPALWGDGYARIKVVARHRRSHRYLTTIVSAGILTNFRAKVVYAPTVAAKIGDHWGDGEAAKRYTEAAAAWPEDRPLRSLGEAWAAHFGPAKSPPERRRTWSAWLRQLFLGGSRG